MLRNERGYTLVELLTVMVMLGFVMTGIITLYLSGVNAQGNMGATFSAQTTPAARTATPPAAGSKAATPGPSGIGSLQWSVTGLDYPAAAAWLTQLAQDPDLSGVSIGGVTETQPGGRPTVAFTSSATLAPQARSDRGSRLTKGGQ